MSEYKTTKVYCAKSANPSVLKNGEISHPIRAAEISAVRNVTVKKNKLFVWKLLEYAYSDFFGKKFCDDCVVKGNDGKWKSADGSFFFSLSHTDDICAVAIGFVPCGVDVEGFDRKRFGQPLAKKILCESEYEEYERLTCDEGQIFCAQKWTQKESAFKKNGGELFVPRNIRCSDFVCVTKTLLLEDRQFFLSLCAQDAKEAEFELML